MFSRHDYTVRNWREVPEAKEAHRGSRVDVPVKTSGENKWKNGGWRPTVLARGVTVLVENRIEDAVPNHVRFVHVLVRLYAAVYKSTQLATSKYVDPILKRSQRYIVGVEVCGRQPAAEKLGGVLLADDGFDRPRLVLQLQHEDVDKFEWIPSETGPSVLPFQKRK
jgi:hypothetical protein